MMTRRTDVNQAEIAAVLRACGWSVCDLHAVGQGCPDLLVGVAGRNLLLEVKTEQGRLTPAQRVWHEQWRGQIAVVRSVEDAIAAVVKLGRE